MICKIILLSLPEVWGVTKLIGVKRNLKKEKEVKVFVTYSIEEILRKHR